MEDIANIFCANISSPSFLQIWINWFVMILSVISMWGFMAVFAVIALGNIDTPLNVYGVFYVCWTTPLYWLGLMLIVVIGILPRYVFMCCTNLYLCMKRFIVKCYTVLSISIFAVLRKKIEILMEIQSF
jgi:hypothetical protein